MLSGRTIILGVCGGIAAYKSADLCSRLVQRGARVRVLMTANATHFVSPVTFQALSSHPVGLDTFDAGPSGEIEHVALADEADVAVVAPATANFLAKLAAGIADDLLTTTMLALDCPLLVAPAMNPRMWANPATQENAGRLRGRGLVVLEPNEGRMACGHVGAGRLPEPAVLEAAIEDLLRRSRDMDGLKVLVTAGPTREAIDPVRFLTNASSGKMGFALAEAAAARGASVVLVSGPSALPTPRRVKRVDVESAEEMRQAALLEFPECDVVLAAAAVADYAPEEASAQKIKKSGDVLTLRLRRTPDILAEMGRRKGDHLLALVGFAAETQDLVANARQKLLAKNADLIVANDVTEPGSGFQVDTNRVTFVTADEVLPQSLKNKRQVAEDVLDHVGTLIRRRRSLAPLQAGASADRPEPAPASA